MTNKQILVVDNDLFVRDIFAQLLCDHGFDIQTAKSNDDAFEYLKTFKFDLILSDIHMEGMSFSEFLDLIKQQDSLKFIPIIAVTGVPSTILPGDRQRIQGVLEKPFSPETLIQNVELVLQSQFVS